MSRKTTYGMSIGMILLLAVILVVAAPKGIAGAAQVATTPVEPESCATCHSESL